jgi:hypothetical protein
MEDFIEMITENRVLEPFEVLELDGIGEIIVAPGDEYAVEVSCDDESLIDKVKTRVKKGKLKISMNTWFTFWPFRRRQLEIYVMAPALKEIKMSGIGKIISEGAIKGDHLKVTNEGVGKIELQVAASLLETKLAGTGDIDLEGTAQRHEVRHEGVGKIDAGRLQAEDVDVKSSGLGDSIVHATRYLDVKSSGIGGVRYFGTPEIRSKMSGLGGIEKADK